MPLSEEQAVKSATDLIGLQGAERGVLDNVRRYWKGRQALPETIPVRGVPKEVRALAHMSRVNVMEIVVESLSQSLFVEGFRSKDTNDNADVWAAWQANRMDARQSGIHRAAVAYGAAYTVVLPGDTAPVIRGLSPRNLTARYGDDPDWPDDALERRSQTDYRLYDASAVYELKYDGRFTLVTISEHGLGVTPVVRYLEADDLDREDDAPDQLIFATRNGVRRLNAGQVAPLMSIQDQIDETTFELLVAQHYASFRQRYILGWTPKSEEEGLKASATRVWAFEDKDVKAGEFSQTDTSTFLDNRQSSIRHAATLSQTPVHELIGEMVNLSAEALAAAEAGRDRKVADRQTLIGESHEQTFELVGKIISKPIPDDAQVVWRETSARSFAAVVDALGKLATSLGVPPEELWERVPGVTQADVERWKAAKKAQPEPMAPGIEAARLTETANAPIPATGDGQPTPPQAPAKAA
jgi:Phage portal protein, SPP1 Gp6-like